MNVLILTVACITLLALVAHVFAGTKETATIAPASQDEDLTANWVQAMCAFQMLTVDLLVVAVALFAVAFSDLGQLERPIVLSLSLLFFLWGLVWVIQLKFLNRRAAGLLRLPHWMVWFLCSGLLYLGS
ncbi:hypothetical protein [Anderseniella sp. Alg231-50]|uniref:hypothetical protein n=1 Tax=Anderseniella sp. Alg231-50 TaxID=1922226 RepID=UPI000D553A92